MPDYSPAPAALQVRSRNRPDLSAHVPSAHSHPPAVVVCPPPQRSAGARVQASRYSPSNYNYGQWRAPPAHSVLVSQTLPTSALQEIGRKTFELQSLMRISYAVFCLKKKKQHTHKLQNNQH